MPQNIINFLLMVAPPTAGLLIGVGISYISQRTLLKQKAQAIILDAKEKALQSAEQSKQEDEARRKELRIIQQKLERYQYDLDGKHRDLTKKIEETATEREHVSKLRHELTELKNEAAKKLETIAGVTAEDARELLMKHAQESLDEAFLNRLSKLDRPNSDELERKARNLLSLVIQRVASSHSVETTTTKVQLPAEDMKGRIIGKEGRNIKAIEEATGTEIIIDETPGVITVSGFSPIRRQIARLTIEKLMSDGRIHPGRIEEMVEEAKKDLALDIKKAGEDALFELGIPVTSLDPKLVAILGRLKYRTSYGQNVLRHSIEVAQISTLLAQELGADVLICKKGGILHDIGKAVDHDTQGGHPEIGYNIMKKFGLPEEICYQSIGHHEDKPKTIEAIIVKAADAISGARPGARRDTHELYVQRLEEIERTAMSFNGVEKVYAIQAGREVRVFVNPKSTDDFGAFRLAQDIAKKIEAELQYPGEIKVNVIRETRVVEYAR